MEQVRGRFDRLGRTKACEFYAFRDTTRAMPSEDELMVRLGILEAEKQE